MKKKLLTLVLLLMGVQGVVFGGRKIFSQEAFDKSKNRREVKNFATAVERDFGGKEMVERTGSKRKLYDKQRRARDEKARKRRKDERKAKNKRKERRRKADAHDRKRQKKVRKVTRTDREKAERKAEHKRKERRRKIEAQDRRRLEAERREVSKREVRRKEELVQRRREADYARRNQPAKAAEHKDMAVALHRQADETRERAARLKERVPEIAREAKKAYRRRRKDKKADKERAQGLMTLERLQRTEGRHEDARRTGVKRGEMFGWVSTEAEQVRDEVRDLFGHAAELTKKARKEEEKCRGVGGGADCSRRDRRVNSNVSHVDKRAHKKMIADLESAKRDLRKEKIKATHERKLEIGRELDALDDSIRAHKDVLKSAGKKVRVVEFESKPRRKMKAEPKRRKHSDRDRKKASRRRKAERADRKKDRDRERRRKAKRDEEFEARRANERRRRNKHVSNRVGRRSNELAEAYK